MSIRFRTVGAFAIATLLPACGLAAAADTSTPPPLGRLIDVGGYRVHLYCTGTGAPTVVVAGSAFSFDWGLVQPEVAKFTRVCTYDPSGTTWSDSYPTKQRKHTLLCDERVVELHHLLQRGSLDAPYVLVGFSIGGLWARLFARKFPNDVAGMVIVDHAFTDVISDASRPAPVPLGSNPAEGDQPPVLLSAPSITLGFEDDQNFGRLPKLNRQLHAWAVSVHPVRPGSAMAEECVNAIEEDTKEQAYPLGNRPLVVVRTTNDLPAYGRLQAELLGLSRNSKQVVAENSSHIVIIDAPEIVVDSIRKVVEAVKDGNLIR